MNIQFNRLLALGSLVTTFASVNASAATSYNCTNPDGKPRNIQIRYAPRFMTDTVEVACFGTPEECERNGAKWLRAMEKTQYYGSYNPVVAYNIEKPASLFPALWWTNYTVIIRKDAAPILQKEGCADFCSKIETVISCKEI